MFRKSHVALFLHVQQIVRTYVVLTSTVLVTEVAPNGNAPRACSCCKAVQNNRTT